MGISVNDSKLLELARIISEWPGLVSRPADELVDDSLVLLDHLGDARTVVDVGSGGGLPGLPLRIARPVNHRTVRLERYGELVVEQWGHRYPVA